ncbi:MAG TPA: flavin reductase [Clostridia bacterium]|nr:flavin reductase [Clostridia bacterium]
MKKEFYRKPEKITEKWPGELEMFAWEDFLTAIPSPIFLATSYKQNGRENACLQSWATFVGNNESLFCILAAVNRNGHFYESLTRSGVCVLNFASAEYYDKCMATITNNGMDDDEITKSGFTSEPAITVNAPRIAECFLNIECELAWQRELQEGSPSMTIALKSRHITMDESHYNESLKGRYGKTGYIYNIHSPRNPDTGQSLDDSLGILEILKKMT